MKHEETLIGDREKKDVIKHAFGAFSRIMWKNDAIFHGNEESYLFSLYPKFKNFYALRKHDCEKNYQYLWYNEHGKNVAKVGLGMNEFFFFLIFVILKDLVDSVKNPSGFG